MVKDNYEIGIACYTIIYINYIFHILIVWTALFVFKGVCHSLTDDRRFLGDYGGNEAIRLQHFLKNNLAKTRSFIKGRPPFSSGTASLNFFSIVFYYLLWSDLLPAFL